MLSAIAWAIVGIVLIIAEIFSLTFFLLFFGISSLLVAVAKTLGLNHLPTEIVMFALLGVVGVFIFRQKLKATLSRSKGFAVDEDKIVTLSDDIPAHGEGRISYQGTMWTAVNDSPEPLIKGQKSFIERVDGVKLFLRHYTPRS